MGFEFATAGRIVFGAGAIGTLGSEAAALGRRALLVGGRNLERSGPARRLLEAQGVAVEWVSVDREPTVGIVRRGTEQASRASVDLVVGIGGGSVMDAAKAISAILTNGGDPLDYLEVVGAGSPLTKPTAPLILAPTTAGTGTEATKNAVLLSEEHRVKASLRSPGLLPRLALVDPELTHGLPPDVTAWGGLDALTQLIEPFVGLRPQPLTDAVCREGVQRIARSLRRAFQSGGDVQAREDLSLAALFSGIALANAGLGVVHGFASVIGGITDAHHGMVCASLLAAGMDANVQALRLRDPQGDSLERYRELAVLLTSRADAQPEDGIAWARDLCRDLGVPSLSAMGLRTTELGLLVERTAVASSTKGNPIVLTRDELTAMAQAAM